jgi:hypothetical protein
MGAFSGRFGTRFIVVTVLPNILLIGYVGILLAAGAPARSPSLPQALTSLDHLNGYRVAAIVLGVIVISAATHPLQIPLIQFLEGYWWGLPFGPMMADRATQRFRDELAKVNNELKDITDEEELDWATRNSTSRARFRQNWLPDYAAQLRPTDLGNTLWKGETRAGERYGLDLNEALPRIIPLMSPGVLADLNDRRNQLDAAVRLSVAAGAATAISIGLLLRDGPWLFLALATYVLCWASYRAAVAAARGFSTNLAAAVDLYHLQLFDALSLERPAGIEDEVARHSVLTDFFHGYDLSPAEKSVLRYVAQKPDDKGDTGNSATASPGSAGDFAGP